MLLKLQKRRRKNIDNQKKSSLKKVVKKVFSVLGIAVSSMVAVLFVCIIVQLFSGQEPNIFGYRFYYILTDSMSPGLEVGDAVLSKDFANDEEKMSLKVGDTVTFIGTNGTQNGKTITHRIVAAPYYDEAVGSYFIETKGDKIGAPHDAPIEFKNLKAKMVAKAHLVGFFYRVIATPLGYIFLIIVPVLVVVAILILRLVFASKRKKQEAENAAAREKIEMLKEQAIKDYLENNTEKKE